MPETRPDAPGSRVAVTHVLPTRTKPLALSSRAEKCHRQLIDRGTRFGGPRRFTWLFVPEV